MCEIRVEDFRVSGERVLSFGFKDNAVGILEVIFKLMGFWVWMTGGSQVGHQYSNGRK